MDLAALKAEIELGPLANQLRQHWERVFTLDDLREAVEGETPEQAKARESRNNTVRARAGQLHPDAAFEIARILAASAATPTDPVEFSLAAVTMQNVLAAKGVKK